MSDGRVKKLVRFPEDAVGWRMARVIKKEGRVIDFKKGEGFSW